MFCYGKDVFDVRHTTHRERQHDRGEIIYGKSSLQGFERRDGGRGDLVITIPVWRDINDAAEKQVLDHWIVHGARTYDGLDDIAHDESARYVQLLDAREAVGASGADVHEEDGFLQFEGVLEEPERGIGGEGGAHDEDTVAFFYTVIAAILDFFTDRLPEEYHVGLQSIV